MSIKFDIKELEVVTEVKGLSRRGGGMIPIYNFPATPREGMTALFERRPIWQTTDAESRYLSLSIIPDNVARCIVTEAAAFPEAKAGGKDMFGIEWEFIPAENGSMVRPGKPLLADANEWYEKLKWPDIESWDWEGNAALNKNFLRDDTFNVCWFLNGWFERLITFLDFENAILSLVDEDQSVAVKDLLIHLSDLYIKIFDKILSYYPQISCFMIHDDWGAQKETFFNPDIVAEYIVPAMKKVTDYLHGRGKYCELHSCGQNFKQVPNMIAAGWDCWVGQLMNDTHRIYEMYGDQILIGVTPEHYDPALGDEELRASARLFAQKFCNPAKPCLVNLKVFPRAFREELYIQSRIRFSE
jgi:hypothetical protein